MFQICQKERWGLFMDQFGPPAEGDDYSASTMER